MAMRKYECIGIFPLAFPDKQMVESGETFLRDFEAHEAKTGPGHEAFLINTGQIRRIEIETPAPAQIKEAVDGFSDRY